MNGSLKLLIYTPGGKVCDDDCDAVDMIAVDNKEGENGGSIGIRYGHAPAVIALAEGELSAKKGGTTVFRATLKGGYARVLENVVTVVTEDCTGIG
ncbi:MAG: hypothetical protein J5793_00810 [Clostridia bacterium]|nr:hypothetical protein [Clostridia bacterium]